MKKLQILGLAALLFGATATLQSKTATSIDKDNVSYYQGAADAALKYSPDGYLYSSPDSILKLYTSGMVGQLSTSQLGGLSVQQLSLSCANGSTFFNNLTATQKTNMPENTLFKLSTNVA